MSALVPAAVVAATSGEQLLGLLLAVLVGIGASAGVGAALATLRVILPGVASAADRSLARVAWRRLVAMGLLPLLGVALLGRAVEASGSQPLAWVYVLAVVVPAGLLTVLGALAAVPHLGERLLERGAPRSLLARAVGGGIVLGLCCTTWWIPPLFAIVALLVVGWFLGIGLGTAVGAGTRPRGPRRPIEGLPPEPTV